jgi:hypothetical protein
MHLTIVATAVATNLTDQLKWPSVSVLIRFSVFCQVSFLTLPGGIVDEPGFIEADTISLYLHGGTWGLFNMIYAVRGAAP